MRTLRGRFTGASVETGSGSMCGVGELKIGNEYVFFFPDIRHIYIYDHLQPAGLTTEEILQKLPKPVK